MSAKWTPLEFMLIYDIEVGSTKKKNNPGYKPMNINLWTKQFLLRTPDKN